MSRTRQSRARAFTLVEVILSILIISAIMGVLFYFYHRSVEVRQTVLEEAEFLSVSRMLMEQMTGELRAARTVQDPYAGLEGSSNSISFVCAAIPQSPRWIINTNEAVTLAPLTDLRRVAYRLLAGTNFADIRGLDRTEELLTAAAFTSGASADFAAAPGTNSVAGEDPLLAGGETQLIRRPLTQRIKFLQFRYWAGTNWTDSWNSFDLPAGVEITIGKDPLPPEQAAAPGGASEGEEFPFEIFRRVVYLPGSVPPANQVVWPEQDELIY